MRYSKQTIITGSMQANTAGATGGGAAQGGDVIDISSGANDSQIFRSCLHAYFQKRLSSSPVSSGDEVQPRQSVQPPQDGNITYSAATTTNDSQATLNTANNNASTTFVIATSPPVQYTNLLFSAPSVLTTHTVPATALQAGSARRGRLSDSAISDAIAQLTVYSDTDELVGLQDNSPLSSSTQDVTHMTANQSHSEGDGIARHTPSDPLPLGSARSSSNTLGCSPAREGGSGAPVTPRTRSLSSTTHERSPASTRTSPCPLHRPVPRRAAASASPTTLAVRTTTSHSAEASARRSLTPSTVTPTLTPPLPSPPPAARALVVKKTAPTSNVTPQKTPAQAVLSPSSATTTTTPASPAMPQNNAPTTTTLVVEEEEELCCICLETYTKDNPQFFSACKHHFHLPCLLAWKNRCNTCPMCNMETLQGIGENDEEGDGAKHGAAGPAPPLVDTSADAVLAQQLQAHYQRQLRRMRRAGQTTGTTRNGTISPSRPEPRPTASTTRAAASARASQTPMSLTQPTVSITMPNARLPSTLRPPEAPNMNAREHNTRRVRQRVSGHESEKEKACSVM